MLVVYYSFEGNTVIGKLDQSHVLEKNPEEKKKTAVEWGRKCMGV